MTSYENVTTFDIPKKTSAISIVSVSDSGGSSRVAPKVLDLVTAAAGGCVDTVESLLGTQAPPPSHAAGANAAAAGVSSLCRRGGSADLITVRHVDEFFRKEVPVLLGSNRDELALFELPTETAFPIGFPAPPTNMTEVPPSLLRVGLSTALEIAPP